MNNFIKYFYNIDVADIFFNNKFYLFKYNGVVYKLYMVSDINNINYMLDLNKKMLNMCPVSEIILNRNGQVISVYNNVSYILLKIYVNEKKNISLTDISNLNNILYTENLNINWGILWSKKIDYLENLISENGKKYPLIADSFNYFVGMAENAISYYNSIFIEKNYKFVISHKTIKINDTIGALYNPLNIIFDYKVRDVAEYIKNSFFKNNENIFNELNNYLINNSLSLTDVKLLISRLMYPSFYFELYGDILIDNNDEKIIFNIINKTSQYEQYLSNVIHYFKRMYNIDDIIWLSNTNYE